jgi:hypothetical protein
VPRSLGRMPYTVAQAADTLDRPVSTVRRWVRLGRLQAKLVNRRYQVDPARVDDLMNAETFPLPAPWGRTKTGEPMPSVVGAVRRTRGQRSSR